jgi:thiamine monophosphate synthase
MSAAGALQKAVFVKLAGDGALTALIGPDGVHDHLQVRTHWPCVFIAGIDSRDASTASEAGEEHLITLEVRTGEGGNRAAEEIAARVRALLDDAYLALDGFALVSILHRRTRMSRDAKAKGHVAEMVFRAVTE